MAETRAWKLFAVVPIMLLSRPGGIGRIGRDELASRADQFARGDWWELIDLAVQNVSTYTNSKREDSSEAERRGLAAQERVKREQVSRARQALVGAALSPKTEGTLEELRRRRPQAALRQIPQEVMDYAPDSPLALDMKIFAKCLRAAPAGSSAGPGGCSNEMLKVCLDDQETCQLLFLAAEDFARHTAPNVSQCFMLANLTVMTDFGQSNFGQSIFGHRVLLANFGQSIFGQNWCLVFGHFGPMTFLASPFLANPFLANPFWANLCCVCVCFVFVCCVCCVCCVLCVMLCVVGSPPPSAGPPSVGPPSTGPPSAGPPSDGPPAFFFPLQPQFRSFCLSGCLLVEF